MRRQRIRECSFDGDFRRTKMQRVGSKGSSRAPEPLLSPERLSGMPREVKLSPELLDAALPRCLDAVLVPLSLKSLPSLVATHPGVVQVAAGMMEDALSILAQPLLLAGRACVVPLGDLAGDAATEAYGALHCLWHRTHPRAPKHARDGRTWESGGTGSCGFSSEILTGSGRRALAACVARLAAERRRAAWTADGGPSPPAADDRKTGQSQDINRHLDLFPEAVLLQPISVEASRNSFP